MLKELFLGTILLFQFSGCQANEKVYIANPEKVNQLNACIATKKGIQNENWFRIHQDDDFYIDVSSVHGDNIGIYFYESEIKNIDPVRKFCVEYHILFRCDYCTMLQEHLPPPCLNPKCPSRNI